VRELAPDGRAIGGEGISDGADVQYYTAVCSAKENSHLGGQGANFGTVPRNLRDSTRYTLDTL